MDTDDGAACCDEETSGRQDRPWLEKGFSSLLDGFPLPCIVVDCDGRIVVANRHAADLFGYPLKDLECRAVEDLFAGPGGDARDRYCRQFFGAPQARPMGAGQELTGVRSDGSRFPVEIGLSPVDLPAGTVVVCTIADREKRNGDTSAIGQSRQLMQEIIDNTAAVIYMKDRQGRYELVNRRCRELFGKTEDGDIVGRDDSQIFPAEIAAAFRRNDRQVLETGQTLHVEEVAPHADGLHNYLSVKFPLRNAAGRIRAVAGISTDITELMQTKRELENVRHRLELLLNSVSDGIYGLDEHGRTTFVNRAAERMLGWSAEQLLGGRMHELAHHSYANGRRYPEEVCPVHSTIHEAAVSSVEGEVFWRKDGTSFPIEYSSSPLVDEGQIVGAVVTFRDVTERILRTGWEAELRAGHYVQQQLYPANAPEFPGFDVAGATFPAAQVCGDYFDFIPASGRGIILAVGDVSGHGLGPALQMVETRACLRALLPRTDRLDEAVRALNTILAEDIPEEMFVSLFVARLQEDRKLSYVGAGHDAWLLRANGRNEHLPSTGPLLALTEDPEIEMGTPQAPVAGDLLLILTDGIPEAASTEGEMFGVRRVLDVVRSRQHRPSREIIEQVIKLVREFCGARPITDDMTVIVAKVV